MSDVLIINYSNMKSGGIETMLAYLIQYAIKHKIRVIWITSSKLYPQASYQNIIDYDSIECHVMKQWESYFMFLPKIQVTAKDQVVIFSTTPLRYMACERYRGKLNAKSVNHFLCIANFTGESYFPDQEFTFFPIKNCIYRYLSNIIQKIENNNALRAFAIKQLDAYEEYYNLQIKEKQRKILPATRPSIEVTDDTLNNKAKSRKENFKIYTCSRFEFPHKGYLIGLLRVFAELEKDYPNISLTIIGYGDGKTELDQLISTFPLEVSQKIKFTGMLGHDEMIQELQNAHLFIGLAGAAKDAANCSIPTLIVRHYSYSCETYGFYFDACSKGLSSEKGENIKSYIIKTITMDDDSYINNCKLTKKTIDNRSNYNPAYLFEQGKQEKIFTLKDILVAYIINGWIIIKHYVRHINEIIFHKIRGNT